MSAEPARHAAAKHRKPVEHEMPSLIYKGERVMVSAVVRRHEDGSWRGRILFAGSVADEAISTAEILYAEEEEDFWLCVGDLREHHLRDLYRAVSE
jgi:hypothetical protein